MAKLLFFDSTLRDGNHAVAHQINKETISAYCKAIDFAGMHTVIVGHGNGMGASSLQVGLALLDDQEMLGCARANLQNTKLGGFLIPGFGTIKDHIIPALDIGVDLFCVAAHCTEANVTRQHIEYLVSKDIETYGVLMMYHMTSTDILVQQALLMQQYGARGVIIMDSAGASTPEMVRKTIASCVDCLDIRVGFHAHNNMGLAVSNTYTALKEGADIVDATLRGFGAGAGNCQIEAIAALLLKEEAKISLDFNLLCEISDRIIAPIAPPGQGIAPLSIVSGMTGVFSSFAPHVKKAALQFKVNPMEIFIELGRRKVVGGQEDTVVEVAKLLSDLRASSTASFEIESLL